MIIGYRPVLKVYSLNRPLTAKTILGNEKFSTAPDRQTPSFASHRRARARVLAGPEKALATGQRTRSYPDVIHLLASIANAFVENSTVEAVTWGGSTALQRADDLSDYDLYVYSRTPVPLQFREKIISRRARHCQLGNAFWELEDEWTEPNGTEFNVIYRSCQQAEEEIERRFRDHVSSLGYTTAWCFSINHSKILADPNGWFVRLQRQTQAPYPAALLQAILRKNRPVLGGGMQGCYLKQIRAAIVRRDPVSLNHRVAVWLASYFDILFAINGRLHPGEKRLLIYAEELPILPDRALTDVADLCALASKLDQRITDRVESMLARLDKTIARL